MGSRSALRGSAEKAAVAAVFQPIVDLRDGCVVGYEALARPRDGSSPEELFAAARAEGRLSEVDRACRAAALRDAAAAGLGAPFALFLNADAGALELDLPDLPHGSADAVMEITESALTERPEAVLRTLTRLRTRGWGVSLDDVGGDSRSLAMMPLLYPDVIKLDLRLLAEREPLDVARVVTAVGAEAERRHATVLAEGIDSEAQLEMARAAGATLGQGFLLGEPGPLPDPLPQAAAARCGWPASGGDASGPLPYQRVTNWKRPTRGSLELAERTAALLSGQAAALGPTGMLLAAPARCTPPAALRGAARRARLRRRARARRAGGHVDRGRARPGLRRVLRRAPRRRRVAVRDVLRPRAGGRVRAAAHGAAAAASATSAITLETCAPCQASGEAPGLLGDQPGVRDRLGVALAGRVRVLGVDLVAAGDDDRRRLDRAAARPRPRTGASAARPAARRPAPPGARGRRAAGAGRGRSSRATSRARSACRRPRRSPRRRPRAGPWRAGPSAPSRPGGGRRGRTRGS